MLFEELYNLMKDGHLHIGEEYIVEDVTKFPVVFTAKNPNELNNNVISADGKIEMLYDVEKRNVDYMVDRNHHIEGYYDWYADIEDSTNIYLGTGNQVSIAKCKNITIGDYNTGNISGCENMTIGNHNRLQLEVCTNLTIGDENTATMNNASRTQIGNRNDNVSVSSYNIIGSDNRSITVTGDSNIVKYGCIDVQIDGYNNSIEECTYIALEGGYNALKGSSSVALNQAFGNEIEASDTITMTNTHNNTIYTKNLTTVNRDSFIDYRNRGNVRAVTDKVNKINLQSDNNGRTLIVDEMKFRGESETKSPKTYELLDGVWVEVK